MFLRCQLPRAILLCLLGVLAIVYGGRAESLREAAAKFPGLRVGAALNPELLTGSEAAYANMVRYQFNLPSPENAAKWAALRPSEYTFDWTDADVLATFARAGGQQARGHTLLWHQSIPAWLTNGGFNPDQIRSLLFHHIDTVAGRYRNDFFCWDVVNEAFESDGSLRNSFWYNQPGIGYATNGTRYIEEAFRRAAPAAPDAILVYNDYDAETVNAKSDAIYAMAQDFINRGVPLGAIGFQMHRTGLDYNSLRNNFKRFNDLGLDLHITEMDIRIPVTNGVATAADIDAQAEVYWNIIGIALGQPHFKVFQTWGFTDKYSWIPGYFSGYGAALLFDENYQRKPAYWAVWNALANQAEKLPVLDISPGDSTNIFAQPELSAGAGMQLQADAADDYMTLGLNVPFGGAWDVKVGYRRSGASGQFQLATAPEGSSTFTNLGNVVDAYGSTIGTGMTDYGTNIFAAAGNWQFRFTITGKNPNASDYNLTIDYIRITPVATVTNSAPTISGITDKTTSENTPIGPIPVTVGDALTPASALTVQAISLNTNLLPSASIVVGGSGANRTISLAPTAGQHGIAAVLLIAGDGTNQSAETFMLRVNPINTPPNAQATNVAGMPNTPVDVDLLALASDAETDAANLRFQLNHPVGGSVSMLGDGHTARFSPATNYLGPASFGYVVTDTASQLAPDNRWIVQYDFEPPDSSGDKSVTDNSVNALTGPLEEFGTGQSRYDTNVPPPIARPGTHSLALSGTGSGNASRLEVLVPSALYNLRNSDWTLALWFRRDASTKDDFLFHAGAGDGFGGDGDELDLALTPGEQLQLRHYNSADTQDVSITSPAPSGQWHHVAVVFDRTSSNAGALALFLDGNQVGATAAVSWALDQASELVFGGVKKGNEARWLNGSLDDITLYNTVLSPAEIASLAAGQTAAQFGGLSRSNTVGLTIQASNQPPTLTTSTNLQLIAGVPLTIAMHASDPDVPPQALVFGLVNSPPGAVINPTNGLLTWRPAMAQIGSSNWFSVTVTEAGWATNLAVEADAYVRDGSYTNTNFGTDAILTVKQDPTAGFSRETYLRFAVPPFSGRLASAQLRLVPGSANQAGVHAVALVANDAWDESTLTWNTKPVSGPAVATWVPQTGTASQIPLPLPGTEDLVTNGLLSLRIYATNSTGDGRVDYVSREGAASSIPRMEWFYTNTQPLSVTQSFWVKVMPPQLPQLNVATFAAGAFRATVSGDGGPDYTVMVTTNLQDWRPIFTTNGPPGEFQFSFTNSPTEPEQFYRVRLGP